MANQQDISVFLDNDIELSQVAAEEFVDITGLLDISLNLEHIDTVTF